MMAIQLLSQWKSRKRVVAFCVGMASLLTGGTGVSAYFGFNTNTGVIDVNTNEKSVLDLGTSWLGVMYVKNNTSGNTNIQVQFYPGGMSAFGHNVTGTANTGFFNVSLKYYTSNNAS